MPFRLENPAQGRTIAECVACCWQVAIRCDQGHGLIWTAAELEVKFAPAATLEMIAERLVCATCGSREGSVNIWNDVGGRQARDIERFEAETKPAGFISDRRTRE